jgi:hypothetical protein
MLLFIVIMRILEVSDGDFQLVWIRGIDSFDHDFHDPWAQWVGCSGTTHVAVKKICEDVMDYD